MPPVADDFPHMGQILSDLDLSRSRERIDRLDLSHMPVRRNRDGGTAQVEIEPDLLWIQGERANIRGKLACSGFCPFVGVGGKCVSDSGRLSCQMKDG